MKTLVKELSVAPQSALALTQVVLWIGANAGGVGKTTLSVHIGYEMARRGYRVAIIDLDTNVSMAQLCGLPSQAESGATTASIISDTFGGDYPFVTPDWGKLKGTVEVIQGGPIMVQAAQELALRDRREYALADHFEDFPLPHDLVILDCPATLGGMNTVALAACTHLLIPLALSSKSLSGANVLLSWYYSACKSLRLKPMPDLLGIIPSMYNAKEAGERVFLEQLPEMLAGLGVKVYPHVRYSCEFKNASNHGLPLPLYRPGHPAGQDFDPICHDLEQILKGGR